MATEDLLVALVITAIALVAAACALDDTYTPLRRRDWAAAFFCLFVPVAMWAAILDRWWRLQ